MATTSAVRRLLLVLTTLALAVGGLAAVAVGPARADEPVTGITGVVSGASGGLRDVLVVVEPAPGTPAPARRQVVTDNVGRFTLGLAAGRYWVQFRRTYYATEWWDDAVTRGTSTQVLVEDGALTMVDPVLDVGGEISGTTTTDGYVETWAADPTRPGRLELVGADVADDVTGAFTVPWLHAGRYYLRFLARRSKLEGWWAGTASSAGTVTTWQTSTPIDVTARQAVTGVSPTGLRRQGYVSGRVVRADGVPLSGAAVVLWERRDDGTWRQPSNGYATTGSDGNYLAQLPSGTYRVRVSHSGGEPVRDEYLDDATTLADARDLPVEIGRTTVADAALEPVAVLSTGDVRFSGPRRVDSTVRVSGERFYPAAATTSFQWLRDGRPVRGAVGRSYALTARDAQSFIQVRITARAAGYEPRVVLRPDPYGFRVDLATLTVLTPPMIRGRLRVGARLRAVAPRTRPGATASYQWLRNSRPIPGATRATYQIKPRDVDDYFRLRVTVRRPGYESRSWQLDKPGQVRP